MSPVLAIAEGEENSRVKPTFEFVIMLTDVSAGAGRLARLDTDATPSSSLSFYTTHNRSMINALIGEEKEVE